MAKIKGQLEGAQLENLGSDPSNLPDGRIWLRTDTDKARFYDGAATREVTTNDQTQTLTNKTIVVADNTITTAATGNLAATELNAALAELQTDIDTRALDSDLDAHIDDTADAHDASAISVVPAGNLAADDVQEALEELQTDVDTRIANPMDDAGQLIYGGASGAPTKLDAGTDGYIFHGAGAAAPKWLPSVDPQAAINYSLSFSVASNALTIALKDAAGNDPSASSPCKFAFRNATLATGNYSLVSVTSATSLVVSSGATLGSANGVEQNYYVYAMNNGGTVELAISSIPFYEGYSKVTGISNFANNGRISPQGLSSSSLEGARPYSDPARSNLPYRLIGRFRSSQSTAGTWTSTPTEVQLLPMFSLPEIISAAGASTVGSSSGAWVTPSGSSFQLTPGIWRLHGYLQFFRNGGTSNLTGIIGNWSEASGASTSIGTSGDFTDLAGGNSAPYLSFNTAPELDAYILNAAEKLVKVNKVGTIYYNVQLVAGTPANFTFNTGIWAERVL